MFAISNQEQADFISALDLKKEALAAIALGDSPGYSRRVVNSPKYSGTVEVFVCGGRGAVCLNADSMWGDVVFDERHGDQVVALDDTAERYTLDGYLLDASGEAVEPA